MCRPNTGLKKITAILLIAVLLFNVSGYRFLFNYLEQQSTVKLEKQIDAGQYADDQLLEIKIPLNVPYTANTDYGPSYGETRYNGQHYRYVKSKVKMDTLYLLCIPHTEKDQLVAMKSGIEKEISEQSSGQQPQNPGKSITVKLIQSEFLPDHHFSITLNERSSVNAFTNRNTDCISQQSPLTGEQPPETVG